MKILPLHVEPGEGGDDAALPVVMLHGWAMNLRVFDRLRADLAATNGGAHALRASAIDLAGCGRSPWWPQAADFDTHCGAVLAALPPRCVLLGWSLGAKIALALAARHPQRIAALVLLSASPKFSRADDWPQGADPRTLEVFKAMVKRDWQQLIEDFLWLQVRGTRQAEETLQELKAALASQGQPHRDALLAGLETLDEVDLRPVVGEVRQPALVVSGLNDRVTLPEAGRWLAQTLPGARLLEIARTGHAPFISHHAEVAAAIRAFIHELPSGVVQ
jgi:pimeloyl-[acyl-carrier protein] methyl ester esterase